jgi:hypothetical protein
MGKSIFITLDYELFLGNKTGTVQNCLVKPMSELMNVLNKYEVKVTLFVDCAYLYRLNQLMDHYPALQDDFNKIIDSLRRYNEEGHEIQMHFHPQWLYSNYDGTKWNLDFEHYKLSDVEPTLLKTSFTELKQLVETLCNCKMTAYRAGGYCLETYREYVTLFRENGIEIDSSVVPRSYLSSDSVFYDYRNAPNKEIWRFSTSVSKEDVNGQMIELPVSTYSLFGFSYYFTKIMRIISSRKGSYQWGDGVSIFASGTMSQKVRDKFLRIFRKGIYTCSFDGTSSSKLEYSFNQQADIMTIVSHPKCFTTSSLVDLENFIKRHIRNDKFRVVSECSKMI